MPLRKLLQSQSPVGRADAAIIGIFQKPPPLASFSTNLDQHAELQKLQAAYKELKLHCPREGYFFVGTFLHSTLSRKAQGRVEAVCNTLHRLKSQIDGVPHQTPARVLAHPGGQPKRLLLGVYVSRLEIPRLECQNRWNGHRPSYSRVNAPS